MESFQPVSNQNPDTYIKKILFYVRMTFDLQLNTTFRSIKPSLEGFSGKVLDVGCGDSPYISLLNDKSEYTGIDVNFADDFKYQNRNIVYFDGLNIPFPNEEFDNIICTEVLEHVFEYQGLVNEIHRVLKKGGQAIITIPWSARFHYKPHDYFRYTPSSFDKMFSAFHSIKIKSRGTDLTTICSKIIVAYFRNIINLNIKTVIYTPVSLILLPLILLVILIAHLTLFFNIGSSDDPLGYTIILNK